MTDSAATPPVSTSPVKIDVVSLSGEAQGSVALSAGIFGLAPRADILRRVIVWQLAKRRAGTNKTKRRGEISGSTRKIIRQKGSGGARHGSRRAPILRGGGKAHGPVSRDHDFALPKKIRVLGLKQALSDKAREKKLVILDKAVCDAPKTSVLKASLEKLGLLSSALVVGGTDMDENFALSARNLPHIGLLLETGINAYDILRHDKLVLTRHALSALEERLQ